MVLALHISQLQAPAPRPYHRRIAKAMLDDAAQGQGGQVFVRGNADIVLLGEPEAAGRLRDTLTRLFRMDAPVGKRLLSIWQLPADSVALDAYLHHTMTQSAVPDDPVVAPGTIGAMEMLVSTARLTDLIRRQMAVAVVPDGIAPLFRELSFSMRALDTRVNAAGSDLAQKDPYLFFHLASRLDLRMMALLAEELGRGMLPPAPALHLNLTIGSILSPAFIRLAAAADQGGSKLGVEISLMDACANPLAFGAARMVLRAHGYTVVLDQIGHQALMLTRPDTLEPDLVKLDWAPRITGLGSRERRPLIEAMDRIGPDRLVLNRVETQEALAWGVAQGITRFQGRHVDALLAAGRLADCSHAAACTQRQCAERAAATGAAGRSGCGNPARLDSAALTAGDFSLAGLGLARVGLAGLGLAGRDGVAGA
jgi:EAL domain-containing protein (putative c-di-GMP-specific phosphodiesterase class I)